MCAFVFTPPNSFPQKKYIFVNNFVNNFKKKIKKNLEKNKKKAWNWLDT